MNEIMLQGQIECECGNIFYFQSVREEIPCLKCGKIHPNNGEPIPVETTESEQKDA